MALDEVEAVEEERIVCATDVTGVMDFYNISCPLSTVGGGAV